MAMPPLRSTKRVSKSTLSMFLRTRCDKELFLSLHDKTTMGAAGMPEPVKRPGIGTLSVEGREFEIERNDQLVRLFPGITRHRRSGQKYDDVALEPTLLALTASPAIILQGRFSVSAHKDQTLRNIGLTAAEVAVVPDIADFIPDVLVVRAPFDGDQAIHPDGLRRPVNAQTETRLAIDIFDIKHTSEANPSYCAEIAMYALMLANWLHHHPVLRARYYVTTNAFLWTRFRQGDSELDRLEQAGGATTEQLLAALVADSEDANLHFYLATVRRFFEDVVRVIRIGDVAPDAWTGLEWHVCGTCSNCDWLGDKRHLGQTQRATVDANPEHYCMPEARRTGHLSLVPGITRGARKILQLNAIPDTTALSRATGHPSLQCHTLLKREARSLPVRSGAIIAGTLSNDPAAAIASLASGANLLLYASINFDSSSGLLTGLALSGVATNFTRGQRPRRFQAVPYLVDQKTLTAEWMALEAFLIKIADCIEITEQMVTGNPTGQIHFWEERQFKELCNAMGRHLPQVLALTNRKAKALAWLFPAEELVARPESLEAATVVTVEDVVRRLVFTPTPHVITLFDTAEHYNAGFIHTVRDSYYREYLSNGIPRERIYEIWGNATQVRRGTTVLLRANIVTEYSKALETQCKALESVCERLRTDYHGQFKARSTRIPATVPQGARSVAFDGKLWIWWDMLDFKASQLEAHIRLALDGERLEATYEAIVLTNGRQISPTVYEFTVSNGSLEAKFKEDSMLTLGKIGRPGMPLEHLNSLIAAGRPSFRGNQDLLYRALWSLLKVSLVQFDRVNAIARVELTCREDPSVVPYLLANASVNLLTDVFLLENKKPSQFDWSRVSSGILQEIRNPAIAIPDQNAANAMGIAPRSRRGGTDPVTPAAQVLWQPDRLEQQTVIPRTTASAIGAYVRQRDDLNPFQEQAVVHAVERALTVIWGPPGTGKTNTLAAFLHGLAWDAAASARPLKILVTGPTYKAVEEIMDRTVKLIAADPVAACAIYFGYSQDRPFGNVPTGLPPHVSYNPIKLNSADPDFQGCIAALTGATGVVIVGCQVRQARRFPRELSGTGALVHPAFDVVIVDESSQVPVSQALSAFCGLKHDARLVIAGDHLQMPPITSIEPPKDASYLVGSVQTYLLKRAFAAPVNPCVLQINYRSNDHIVDFARCIEYPQALTAHFGATALHLFSPLPNQAAYPGNLPWCGAFDELLSPANKVVTLLHEDEVSSQGNHFEARMVAGIVWMLRNSVSVALDGRGPATHVPPPPHRFWAECIGVVTPHRAQRALVIRELEALFPGEKDLIEAAVDTVERFQGGQRHTIIVTFGVADTDVIGGEEAFLMQLERTNVAVSRAMAKSIVVMPKTLANHIPEDKRAIATAFALKLYVEEFCNVRVDTTLSDTAETRRAEVRYHG